MTATRTWIRNGTLVLASVAMISSPLAAQRMPRGDRPPDREQLERRVRARFAEVMKSRLGLTNDESVALDSVMDELGEERSALRRDEQALRYRMAAIVSDDQASDDEAREVLQRMGELRLREARLFQTEQERLLEILSPVQVARFHAMREQLAARIRQLRGRPQGPGRRPGGGEPDGDPWMPLLHF